MAGSTEGSRRWGPVAVALAVAVGAALVTFAAVNDDPASVDAVRLAAPAMMLAGVAYLQVRRRPPDWTADEHRVVAVAAASGLLATVVLTAWAVYASKFSASAVTANGESLLLAASFGLLWGTVGGRLYAAERHVARQLRAERERLDRFASVLSHDLRTPLTVAKSRLALAREEPDGGHLDDVDDALDRMEGLVEEVLTLARGGDAEVETVPVDPGELARSVWGDLPDDEAELRVADPPVVDADRRKLRRLLRNLLENARQHADPSTVVVGELEEGGFYVADDGPGVDPADRDRVFEQGYTTADGGHGLGLAIVAALTAAHGWEVTYAEREDGGARFEVRIGG